MVVNRTTTPRDQTPKGLVAAYVGKQAVGSPGLRRGLIVPALRLNLLVAESFTVLLEGHLERGGEVIRSRRLWRCWRGGRRCGCPGLRPVLRARFGERDLQKLVARFVVEVALVAGLQSLADVEAGAQHRLLGPCRFRGRQVLKGDALTFQHHVGGEDRLVEAVAGERILAPCGHRGVLRDAGPAHALGQWSAGQPASVLVRHDEVVEVSDEVGDLIVGQHRRRAKGREQALRGEV